MVVAVLADQERSSEMRIPRNLKVPTLSTPFMQSGAGTTLHFLLKSAMISLVFVVLSERLFTEHQAARRFISSLCAISSPPEMSPTTVVSLANLMKMFDKWAGVQS